MSDSKTRPIFPKAEEVLTDLTNKSNFISNKQITKAIADVNNIRPSLNTTNSSDQ